MTTIKIDLPDQQAEALKARATAQGMTLEGWFRRLAEDAVPIGTRRYSLSELVAQCDPDAPLSDEDQVWTDTPGIGREAL